MIIGWIKNKLGQRAYAASHENAVFCGENADKKLVDKFKEFLPKNGTAADSNKLGGKVPSDYSAAVHKHTKSDISDFPTSMPASDVPDWAKANTKPSYKWSEIGNKPNEFPPSSHKHSKSDISDFPTTMPPSTHTHTASEVSAGTFSGKVVANANAVKNLGEKQTRNIYAGETELISGTSALPTGDIYVQFE